MARLSRTVARIHYGSACETIIKEPPPQPPGPNANHNIRFMGGPISQDFAEDSVAFSRKRAASRMG